MAPKSRAKSKITAEPTVGISVFFILKTTRIIYVHSTFDQQQNLNSICSVYIFLAH